MYGSELAANDSASQAISASIWKRNGSETNAFSFCLAHALPSQNGEMLPGKCMSQGH